mmetsp:Transcript_38825/g.34511  ORF Transcript_38825/g.34511 Transcript_38825/m.34511 type:complete len:99 (+) Transcript_38825:170-466(+)
MRLIGTTRSTIAKNTADVIEAIPKVSSKLGYVNSRKMEKTSYKYPIKQTLIRRATLLALAEMNILLVFSFLKGIDASRMTKHKMMAATITKLTILPEL